MIAFILLAAGSGTRFSAHQKKQYHFIDGKPMLQNSLDIALNHSLIDVIQPVLAQNDSEWGFEHDKILSPIMGGDTRQQSVFNGLKTLENKNIKYVLIHDSARPFITHQFLNDIISALQQCDGNMIGVCPTLPMRDTIHISNNGDVIDSTMNRDYLHSAQTPQAFIYNDIWALHQQAFNYNKANIFSDDVSIALHYNKKIKNINGLKENIKVTYQQDIYKNIPMFRIGDFRIGQGYDIHALQTGGKMVLGGYRFDCGLSLKAHSDGDVILHALCDAIYGALGLGDIGQHFPPSDQQWHNQDSTLFLNHALNLCHKYQFMINNIDITLICEKPKITPIHTDILNSLNKLTHCQHIGLKATTNEKLGTIGRGEGMACLVSLMLCKNR